MKILLVTAIWQRHELAKVILNKYRHWDVMRLAVGSEGDSSRQVAESCGWHYFEHPNSPLTHKFSALFQKAKEYNPDAIMLMGSDDLISEKVLAYYRQHFDASRVALMGFKDIYFFHQQTGNAIRHKGFIGTKSPFTIGCGRIFSKPLLDLVDWKLWGDESKERGLDITTSRILERMGIKETQVTMEEAGMMIDVKTNIGLTDMETFNFNCEKINPSIFDFEFSEQLNEINNIFTK